MHKRPHQWNLFSFPLKLLSPQNCNYTCKDHQDNKRSAKTKCRIVCMLLFLQQQKRVCVGGIYLYFLIQTKKIWKNTQEISNSSYTLLYVWRGAKTGGGTGGRGAEGERPERVWPRSQVARQQHTFPLTGRKEFRTCGKVGIFQSGQR